MYMYVWSTHKQLNFEPESVYNFSLKKLQTLSLHDFEIIEEGKGKLLLEENVSTFSYCCCCSTICNNYNAKLYTHKHSHTQFFYKYSERLHCCLRKLWDFERVGNLMEEKLLFNLIWRIRWPYFNLSRINEIDDDDDRYYYYFLSCLHSTSFCVL